MSISQQHSDPTINDSFAYRNYIIIFLSINFSLKIFREDIYWRTSKQRQSERYYQVVLTRHCWREYWIHVA